MRVHSGVGESDAGVRCRALVGGFGMPGLRDLDFGRQVVEYLQELDWPEEVVVEDLSCSAHLALHRLQELRPIKVVLMATVARGADPPGTLRRYRLDLTPPPPDEVHQGLVETLGGMTNLDHTLAVVRHWGGFPADTIVIEVEPSDCSFGPGFSEELGECIEPILAMIREELGSQQGKAGQSAELSVEELISPPSSPPNLLDSELEQPSDGLLAMAEYALEHERQRLVQPYRDRSSARKSTAASGLDVAVRDEPWGLGLGAGGAWYDLISLPGGRLMLIMGDVVGRGAEAVAAMSELRAAARAYALLDDRSPALLTRRMDRLLEATELGRQAALACLVLALDTGDVRLSNAGPCLPLLLTGDGKASFVEEGTSPPLGAGHDGDRPEGRARLAEGSTLLLFNKGLLQTPKRSVGAGMELLGEAAAGPPRPLEELCSHVAAACLAGVQRDDDVLLLALRVPRLSPRPETPVVGAPPNGRSL